MDFPSRRSERSPRCIFYTLAAYHTGSGDKHPPAGAASRRRAPARAARPYGAEEAVPPVGAPLRGARPVKDSAPHIPAMEEKPMKADWGLLGGAAAAGTGLERHPAGHRSARRNHIRSDTAAKQYPPRHRPRGTGRATSRYLLRSPLLPHPG